MIYFWKNFKKWNNFVKFWSERRRLKTKIKKDEKIQLLFKKPKILYFYWNENLNPLRCQLLRNFWKKFFGSDVTGNSWKVIFAKKLHFFCRFLPSFDPKILVITVDPRKIFQKLFYNWNWERLRFSLRLAKFSCFQKEVDFS